jgi:hypothetical protein
VWVDGGGVGGAGRRFVVADLAEMRDDLVPDMVESALLLMRMALRRRLGRERVKKAVEAMMP